MELTRLGQIVVFGWTIGTVLAIIGFVIEFTRLEKRLRNVEKELAGVKGELRGLKK